MPKCCWSFSHKYPPKRTVPSETLGTFVTQIDPDYQASLFLIPRLENLDFTKVIQFVCTTIITDDDKVDDVYDDVYCRYLQDTRTCLDNVSTGLWSPKYSHGTSVGSIKFYSSSGNPYP